MSLSQLNFLHQKGVCTLIPFKDFRRVFSKTFHGVPVETNINKPNWRMDKSYLTVGPKRSLGILVTKQALGFLGPTPDLPSWTTWGSENLRFKRAAGNLFFRWPLLCTSRSPLFLCPLTFTRATNSQDASSFGLNSLSFLQNGPAGLFSIRRKCSWHSKWYTAHDKCVLRPALTFWDSTISNQECPHLLSSLSCSKTSGTEPALHLRPGWSHLAEKGRKPTEAWQSWAHLKGSGELLPTTKMLSHGLPRLPSGWAPQDPGSGDSGHWARAWTENRPVPDPNISRSSPFLQRRG